MHRSAGHPKIPAVTATLAAATGVVDDDRNRPHLESHAPGIALAVLLLLGCSLPGITEPYGGFLAFSEAWYTLVARGFETGSLLFPQVAPGIPDFNLPPLFSWMLYGAFSTIGYSEMSARIVAIIGAALAVLATGLIGGPRSALLLATTPAFVLLGRNVQPDTWSTALALVAFLAWNRRRPVASALAFSLALMTKPTVLLFPAALAVRSTVHARGLSWLARRHLAWGLLATVPCVAWVVVQLVLHPEPFIAGLRHGGGAFEWPDLNLLRVLVAEVVFAGFPLLIVLASLAWLKRWRGDELAPSSAAWVLLVGLASFVAVHYHGYYLVALAPAGAILSARLLPSSRLIATALIVLNCTASLIYLGGHKLERHAVAQLAQRGVGARFALNTAAYDGYWTLFALYGSPLSLHSNSCVDADFTAPVFIIPAENQSQPEILGYDRPLAVALGWVLVSEAPQNPHRLAWGPILITRSERLSLGYRPSGEVNAIGATLVPPGHRYCPLQAP